MLAASASRSRGRGGGPSRIRTCNQPVMLPAAAFAAGESPLRSWAGLSLRPSAPHQKRWRIRVPAIESLHLRPAGMRRAWLGITMRRPITHAKASPNLTGFIRRIPPADARCARPIQTGASCLEPAALTVELWVHCPRRALWRVAGIVTWAPRRGNVGKAATIVAPGSDWTVARSRERCQILPPDRGRRPLSGGRRKRRRTSDRKVVVPWHVPFTPTVPPLRDKNAIIPLKVRLY